MKIKLPKPRKPKYGEIVVTWTILTVAGLFGGQYWFHSWSMATTYAGEMPATGAAYAEMKATQHEKMASGALSIDEAMQRIASADRNTIPLIAPEASADMGPAAGWMHMPGYEAPPAFDGAPIPEPVDEAQPDDTLEEALDAEPTPAEETVAPSPEAAPRGTGRPETATEPRGAGMLPQAPTAMVTAMVTAPAAPMVAAPMVAAPMTTAMMNAPAAAAAAAQDTE